MTNGVVAGARLGALLADCLRGWVDTFRRRQAALVLLALASLLVLGVARAEAADYDWQLPDWMPPPPVPAGNPMSAAKVELGRHLFFDSRLSGPGYLTCGHCHRPELGLADFRAFSFGMSGRTHPRNTPGLANAGYLSPLGWVDPELRDLEAQSLVPLLNTEPVEMMAKGMVPDIVRRLEADRGMRERFAEAFPETAGRIDLLAIQRALAAFQRSLVSFESPFDRWRYDGDAAALGPEARRGWEIFSDPATGCTACHTPPLFTDAVQPGVPRESPAGIGRTAGAGHARLTDAEGRPVRTPSLRNAAIAPPFMHDSRHATLAAVLEGARTASGEALDRESRRALQAFLEALTDEAFLTDPRHGSPYRLAVEAPRTTGTAARDLP